MAQNLLLANNKIESVHRNVFQMRNLSILNLENNDVRNFPVEIGMLKLKNIGLKGNPSPMLKSPVFRKVPPESD